MESVESIGEIGGIGGGISGGGRHLLCHTKCYSPFEKRASRPHVLIPILKIWGGALQMCEYWRLALHEFHSSALGIPFIIPVPLSCSYV